MRRLLESYLKLDIMFKILCMYWLRPYPQGGTCIFSFSLSAPDMTVKGDTWLLSFDGLLVLPHHQSANHKYAQQCCNNLLNHCVDTLGFNVPIKYYL